MRPRFGFPVLLCILLFSLFVYAQSNTQPATTPTNTGAAAPGQTNAVTPAPATPSMPGSPETTTGKEATPKSDRSVPQSDATTAQQPPAAASGKENTPKSPDASADRGKPADKSTKKTDKPESDENTTGVPSEPPAAPTTTILDKSTGPSTTTELSDGHDPFLDVPPMPKGNVSLIGGVVRHIDRIRDRISVEPFGGKPLTVQFDERTHIYRDGIETTQMGIAKGDRIYVDTMLDHTHVFARNIHVVSETQPADARGQLLGFRNGVMVVQDELSGQPVRFRTDASTAIKKNGAAVTVADLQPGALLAVHFSPDKANRGIAREVTVYAVPGESYVFAGEVTHLNVATGALAVHNQSDNKTYEIIFDPAQTANKDDLQVGSQVNVRAQFTGHTYQAQQISVTNASAKDVEKQQ